jgi:hypothetical protein
MRAESPKRPLRGLLLAGLCAVSAAANAQTIPGYPESVEAYDTREIALLPKYCTYTQLFRSKVPGGNNEVEIGRWTDVFGSTFQHLHHYCWGMMKTNRAMLLARDRGVKNFYLADALKEFDYVIERAPPDFVLLPEILDRKAVNLVRLERGPLALVEFERAMQIKPDYWPPYAHAADFHKDAGQIGKARQVLEEGLKHSPDAAALTRRLNELSAPKKK